MTASAQTFGLEKKILGSENRSAKQAAPAKADAKMDTQVHFEPHCRPCYTTPEFLAKSLALIAEAREYRRLHPDA